MALRISNIPRWLRRTLIAVFLISLVPVAGILCFRTWARTVLEEALAETDRLDPGWRLADIEAARKTLPDAENSALQLLKVHKLAGTGLTISIPKEDDIIQMPEISLSAEQAASLKKHFQAINNVLMEARKLKDMPQGHFPIDYSSGSATRLNAAIGFCQSLRETAYLLDWDAAYRVHAGDAAGALETCMSILNVARSVDDHPSLVVHLVRIACIAEMANSLERTLAQAHFTKASLPALANVQAELERGCQKDLFLVAMRGERADNHEFLNEVASGRGKVGAFTGFLAAKNMQSRRAGEIAEAAMLDYLPGYLTQEHAAYLRYMNLVVDALRLPKQDRDQRLDALEQSAPVIVRQWNAPLAFFRRAEMGSQASLRCAAVAVAAERYRLLNNSWPISLETLLQAGLLKEVPADPFDGKPIRYNLVEDGVVIYSVGPDRIDNDGNLDRDHPLAPGTDFGMRLWDDKWRRQAPKSQ